MRAFNAPWSLKIKSFSRMLHQFFISWGVLGAIYLLALLLLFGPFAEKALLIELGSVESFTALVGLLLLAFLTENIPLEDVNLRFQYGAWGSTGPEQAPKPLPEVVFRWIVTPWRRVSGSFIGKIYRCHEFRRKSFWLGIVLTSVGGGILCKEHPATWVFLCQFPVMRSLFGAYRWFPLARVMGGPHGAEDFVSGFVVHAVLQGILALFGMSLLMVPVETLVRLLPCTLGATAAGACLVLEGDSGRPFLVNLLSLTAGLLAGSFCFYSSWVLLVVGYFVLKVRELALHRFQSVELFDEDTLIA